MITLIVMTDGRRDCLARTIDSLHRLHGPISAAVIHADGGDPDFIDHLHTTYPGWRIIDTGKRSGFAGAYRSAWAWLRQHCTTDWVFSTEDDFVLTTDVDLDELTAIMDTDARLAQLALLRQPWNHTEKAAGGIIAAHPYDFFQVSHGTRHWVTHRRFFTTNPHLVRTEFIRSHDWPDGEQSEGRFGVELFAADPRTVCGFYGHRTDPPRVEHIGIQRVGTGY